MSQAFSTKRYALRVDVHDVTKDKLSTWLSANCNGWICAYEEAKDENKHVHLILDSVKTLKAVRSSFVREFPENAGNKGYSLKLCDDDFAAYIRYICKGNSKTEPPVIWSRQGLLYTDEAVQDAWQKYWVNNASLEENRAKRAKVEKESIIDQVERLCKSKGVRSHDRCEIAKCYIRLFRDARKGINVFAARAVINTVSLLLDGEENSSAENLLANKIADL